MTVPREDRQRRRRRCLECSTCSHSCLGVHVVPAAHIQTSCCHGTSQTTVMAVQCAGFVRTLLHGSCAATRQHSSYLAAVKIPQGVQNASRQEIQRLIVNLRAPCVHRWLARRRVLDVFTVSWATLHYQRQVGLHHEPCTNQKRLLLGTVFQGSYTPWGCAAKLHKAAAVVVFPVPGGPWINDKASCGRPGPFFLPRRLPSFYFFRPVVHNTQAPARP